MTTNVWVSSNDMGMQTVAKEFAEESLRSPYRGRLSKSHLYGIQAFRTLVSNPKQRHCTFQVRIQIGNFSENNNDEAYTQNEHSFNHPQHNFLHVTSYLTITSVKVLIYKEFDIPFEEQT
jgi:hypothetical protein